jgi:dTDP-4-dehydrorhamnose reductase
MVGSEAVLALQARGWEGIGFSHAALDVADPLAVNDAIASVAPDLVFNAAAYTQVDAAEDNRELAWRVNAEGPAWLAEACAVRNVPLVHISTDYVFDGESDRPWKPEDEPRPLGVYGETKWKGEQAVRARIPQHLIIRTSWVYAPHGRNFFLTILRLARERDQLEVVADQWGSPTLAADLAAAMCEAAAMVRAQSNGWGTYHFCNGGETTWHEFASAIVTDVVPPEERRCRRVVPIRSADWPTRAKRPRYSVLDTSSWTQTFGRAPRPWREALRNVRAE